MNWNVPLTFVDEYMVPLDAGQESGDADGVEELDTDEDADEDKNVVELVCVLWDEARRLDVDVVLTPYEL